MNILKIKSYILKYIIYFNLYLIYREVMKIKGLFVHDHRLPKNGVTYYNSYGFDNEFFERYLSFFNRLDIIARKTELSANQLNDTFPVKGNVKFTTVNS